MDQFLDFISTYKFDSNSKTIIISDGINKFQVDITNRDCNAEPASKYSCEYVIADICFTNIKKLE